MDSKQRPKIRPPSKLLDRILEAFALMALVYGIVVVLMHWSSLPNQIPIHFTASGIADGWGSKWMIWILPIISVILVPLMLWLKRFPWLSNLPIKIDEENAEYQYGLVVRLMSVLACIVSWLFLSLLLDTIAIAGGGTSLLGSWMMPTFIVPIVGSIVWYLVVAIRGSKTSQ